jgi:hypothetical protein
MQEANATPVLETLSECGVMIGGVGPSGSCDGPRWNKFLTAQNNHFVAKIDVAACITQNALRART